MAYRHISHHERFCWDCGFYRRSTYISRRDALHPAISRGDQVLVDRTQTSIEDGALYLFHLGPSFALRYAARELGRVILYTTSSVPSQSLTPEQEEEIKILGRVVWVGKKL